MPFEMEQQLFKLDDHEEIKRIQQMWNAHYVAYEKYELDYSIQLGSIVEGNRMFGEQKSIPTPAEQLRMYESMVMAEINDKLDEKDQTKEELYEIDEPGKDDITPSEDTKEVTAQS